ncbi:MAG: DUF5689 domain-containing protein [Bacteroidales bacterium]|nr:DUF5689 domain-containing protein [Bacteroidales bacterium]
MKKRHLIFLLLPLALLALVSCDKTDIRKSSEGDLRVTHKEVNFSYKASSFPITIRTEGKWSIDCEASWLTLSETSADYGKTIFLSTTENDSGALRQTTLVVSGSGPSCNIVVTQREDERNYTDIQLSTDPYGYQKLEGAFLVIPYRRGDKATLGPLSVLVSGSAKGSVSVETLPSVTLSEGEGQIKMKLHGRVGEKGNLLFTVSGLPPTVFGEASQCMVTVPESAPARQLSIAALRSMGTGLIQNMSKVKGVVVSSAEGKVFPDNVFILQDSREAGGGIMVECPGSHTLNPGDECELFMDGASIISRGGVLAVSLPADDDVTLLSTGGALPQPVVISDPQNLPAYESMLCSLETVQVADEELSRHNFSGTVAMDKYACPSGFKIYVPSTAVFASEPFLTGSGNISGIVSCDGSAATALVPQSYRDLEGLTGARLNMHSVFKVDKDFIHNLSNTGETSVSFKLTSSLDWSVKSDRNWLTITSNVSGKGSESSTDVTFDVSPNSGARRRATITVSAEGVPDIEVTVIQLEGNRILDADFSAVITELGDSPKIFPQSAGTDYSQMLDRIGLSLWSVTNCYLSVSPDLKYGLVRVGKTLTKGNMVTPPFSAIGDIPVNIEITMLAGMQSGSGCSWFGIELSGPGEIVAGGDVLKLEKYDAAYTDQFVDTLPCYVVPGLSTSELKRVRITVTGATKDTALKMTATIKGGSKASSCDLFVIGDFHVNYID